ncbi:MAG: PKD domain-containing protein, partial [Flavobacteriales bacterium]
LANSKSTKVNSNTNSDLANSDSNKGNSGSDVSNSDVPNSENSDNTNTAESTLTAEEDFTAFGVDVKNACEGTSVQFELMTETSQGNYLWNFGDGHFSNEANPSHVYNNQGVYDITLSVTSKNDGQIRTKTIEDLIVINPTPVALFDWTFADKQNQKPTVKIENNSQHADQCRWMIDNTEVSSEINPAIALTTKGEHEVLLKVTNQFGCEATKYKYINVDKDYKLLAREQVSPNGDGKYDSFMPEALQYNDQDFKLTVYNNQELIFESTDANVPWEGELLDGSKATVGQQFPWVVILYHENGEEEYYSGTITIIP